MKVLEQTVGPAWRNEKTGGTGRAHWCRRKEICAEIERRLALNEPENVIIDEMDAELLLHKNLAKYNGMLKTRRLARESVM